MIGAAIACNGILRSAFIMDCSQAFAFVALEDFFSLLLAGRGMNAVASGVTIAVQLLASASMGLIVPSVSAHVDKGRFARICGIIRLVLTALFLIPLLRLICCPCSMCCRRSPTRCLPQSNTQFFKMLPIHRCAVH